MIEINEGISAVSSAVTKTNQVDQSGRTAPHSSSHRNKPPRQTFPDNVSLPSGNISFAALQTRNDQLNTTASTVRAANKVMDDVAKVIGEMYEEIIQYEKQYPPFQNQSSEKVEFLNSIASLKKQIDALTLVPENKELGSTVSDPVADPLEISETKEPLLPLRQYGIHSGEDGLNIASINANVSDYEIKKIGQDLVAASQKLEHSRTELAKDAQTVYQQISRSEISIGKEILENEKEVTQKSEKVRFELSQIPDKSLGSEQGQIMLERLE